jgi:AcrR family transcriptional regulator
LAGIREVKKQQTRAAILAEASRLFEQNGYEKTTLADIARDAKIGVGTVYNYFPSKPDLLLGIFDQGLDQEVQVIVAILSDPTLLGTEKIKQISKRFVLMLLEKPRILVREMFKLLLSNEVETPQVLSHVFHADEAFLQIIRQCILMDIQLGKRDSHFPEEQAVAVFYGVLRSEILNYLTVEESTIQSVLEALDTHIDFIFSSK